MELHEAYTKKRNLAEDAVRKMKKEIQEILDSNTDKYQWLNYFAQHQELDCLTRNVAVELVEKVLVTDKKKIEVVFSFGDCYQKILNSLQQAGYEEEQNQDGRIHWEPKEAV